MSCQVYRNKQTNEIEKVLAPNGEDSILFKSLNKIEPDKEKALRAWAQVYTPSFKNWFGDWEKGEGSKVVDENGEPLIVWHSGSIGSLPEWFDEEEYDILREKEFNNSLSESEANNLRIIKSQISEKDSFNKHTFGKSGYIGLYSLGAGFYFGSKIEASEYGMPNPYFLNIKNPLLDSDTKLIEKYNEERNNNGYIPYYGKDDNRDGVIDTHGTNSVQESHEMVVFEPNQIKSVFNQGTFSTESNNIYLSQGERKGKYSPSVLEAVEEFLSRIGVDYEELTKDEETYLKAHYGLTSSQKLQGIADFTSKTIWLTEGNKEKALPEEAVHFATAILRQTNPALFNELIKAATNLESYQRTYDLYKNNPEYRVDGKPNVPKIKKEVADKAIVEHLSNILAGETVEDGFIPSSPKSINKLQEIWDKIINYLKELFGKAEINPFHEVAKMVANPESFIGNSSDINENDAYFSLENNELWDKLQAEKTQTIKIEDESGSYYIRPGEENRKVKNRVTDKVKKSYKQKFKKDVSEEQQNVVAAQGGTQIHADIEGIINRAIDESGFIRKNAEGKVILSDINMSTPHTGDWGIYNTLRDNIVERLEEYPEGTRVLSETIIYDPSQDEAGTIDFMAILPDGKVDILDWKSMVLDTQKYNDIAWFKIKPFQIQIEEYKRILSEQYGVKEFRYTRAIPIIVNFQQLGPKSGSLTRVRIGRVETTLEDEDYLLPVPTESESTGSPKLDSLVNKLVGLYNNILKAPIEDKRRDIKVQQLNDTYKSIRHLQVKGSLVPLAQQAIALFTRIRTSLDGLEPKISEGLSEEDINDMAGKLLEYGEALSIYQNLHLITKEVYGENPSDEEKDIVSILNEISTKAQLIYDDIKSTSAKLINIEAEKRGVNGDILNPERVITGTNKLFAHLSSGETMATKVLYRIVQNTTQQSRSDLSNALDELRAIKEEMGPNKEKYYSMVRKGDQNLLIDQIDPKFYEELKKAIEEQNWSWIKDNVDNQEVENWAKKTREEQIDIINSSYQGDVNKATREMLTKRIMEDTNLDAPYAWLQYRNVSRFPIKEKWYSEEYREVMNDPIALKFYNFIRKWNEVAKDVSYISPYQERNFLPFVPPNKGLKGIVNIHNLNNLLVDEDTKGYGKFNKVTGQPEDVLPKYFTTERGEVSKDLVSNIGIFLQHLIEFRNKKEVEDTIKLLKFVEKNKESLQTSQFGKVIGDSIPGNTTNSKILNDYIKSIFYGQSLNETDYLISSPAATWNKVANATSKFGINLPKYSEEEVEKKVSVMKFVDGLNNFYRLKTLGLNIGTGIAQLFGGTAQAWINSGKYWTGTQFTRNQFKHSAHGVIKNTELTSALIEEFMPADDVIRKKIKALKDGRLNNILPSSFSNFLMGMMEKGEHSVQYANFLSFMDNTIVIDGKLYNARDYYRNSQEYKSRYSLPANERKAMEKDFNAKVDELIKEHGIKEKATVVDGKLSIEGVDLSSIDTFNYKSLIRLVGNKMVGNMGREDKMLAQGTTLMRSLMMFKSWIPIMIENRYSKLKYNEGEEAYQWGRFRTFGMLLTKGALKSVRNSINIISGNEAGIKLMTEMYQEQLQLHRERYNKELGISKEEFFDLTRRNIGMFTKEAMLGLSLLGLYLTFMNVDAPDDEDKGARAFFNYQLRLINKVQDEVTFYYNPLSLQGVLNGSIFPALGVLTDAEKVLYQLGREGFGMVTDDQEITDKAHPTKYVMKMFPITKEALPYLAFFTPDIAKSMDVRVTQQPALR